MKTTAKIRKNFLYPALRQAGNGRLGWVFRQIGKFVLLKFIHPFFPSLRVPGPIMGGFFCTYSCNCNCPMCVRRKPRAGAPDIALDDAKHIIDELVAVDCSGIGITGGEPLVYPHIVELLAYTASKKIPVTLSTNGCFSGEKALDIAEKLSRIPLATINISLDSVDAGKFDALRGTRGGLAAVRDFTGKLVAERRRERGTTKITAMCVVSRDNIEDIPAIVSGAKEMGFDSLGLMPMHRTADGKDASLLLCDDAACLRRFADVMAGIPDLSFIDNSARYLEAFPAAFAGAPFPVNCASGKTALLVDCDSNVYYCVPELELDKPVVNIKTAGATLAQVWNGPLYAAKRKAMSSCRCCYWNCQSELSLLFS